MLKAGRICEFSFCLFTLSTPNSSASSLPSSLGSNLWQVPSICAQWFDLQLEPPLCCTAAPLPLMLSYNFLLANCFIEQLTDKRHLRGKPSKHISSLSCVTMCVLGTKPFSIFTGVRGAGRFLIVAAVPKMFSRDKHHCATNKNLHL